jgi:DNA-binding winged helix-turn-helix (wHTH) protein
LGERAVAEGFFQDAAVAGVGDIDIPSVVHGNATLAGAVGDVKPSNNCAFCVRPGRRLLLHVNGASAGIEDVVAFEEYEIDRTRWQLSWREELTRSIGRRLTCFFSWDRSDRVVGKDELLSALWPESFVEESNLAQHIFLLRKALSRHESGAKIIQTVAGRGYRFAAEVAEIAVVPKVEGQRIRSGCDVS